MAGSGRVFEHRSRLDHPASEVFAWHARPGAFWRLLPPWRRVDVLERAGGPGEGGRTVLALRRGPLRVRWVTRHRDYQEGRQFVDEQVEGPFTAWRHTHRFLPDGAERSVLEDRVEYRLPLGGLGDLLGGSLVETSLARLFRFRHQRTAHDLARHRAVAARGTQRVAVSGASGFVGASLAAFLDSGGHRVDRLVRGTGRPGSTPGLTEIRWDPGRGQIDAGALEGVDAVVHLAGASVAAGRWTAARKAAIRDSRLAGTRLLCRTLAGLARPPRVLVSASAIGFYGDRGPDAIDEASPAGSGFLADVCREWEAETEPAARAGIRVVTLRIGMVIGAAGGALGAMLLPFQLGLGGVAGSGRQPVSWIALDDLVGAIHHLLFADTVVGPVNAVAPGTVTNAELTRALGRVLRRPTVMAMPAAAVRLAFGEMGEALLLGGARVRPARLEASGFRFLHPEIEPALRAELGLGVFPARSVPE